MTAAELPAGSPVALQAAARGQSAATTGPIVVLTYMRTGARQLKAVLSADPALACTSGTGLLLACDQAAAAWRKAESRADLPPSPRAVASVRSLVGGLIGTIMAGTGHSRWCETAIAPPGVAATFLQFFPGTRFVCLHRYCPDVIYSVIQASPWGLSGPDFAGFNAAHPTNTVTALAAYWAAHAGRLLAFEEAHSSACLRVRYEDLIADTKKTVDELREFLGMDGPAVQLPELPVDHPVNGEVLDEVGAPARSSSLAEVDRPGCGIGLPVGQIPAPVLSQVNELLSQLAYEPLEPP
jgi:hypothetical protein